LSVEEDRARGGGTQGPTTGLTSKKGAMRRRDSWKRFTWSGESGEGTNK